MKSNLKIRILSAFLACVILFTGCGSSEELPEVDTNTTENSEVTVEKDETNVVGTPSDETEDVEEEIEEQEPTAEELLQQEWQNYMMANVKYIDWFDMEIAIPAFLTIAIMPFSYSISDGIGFGIISYVILKLVRGKVKEINPLMYVLAVLFILMYVL